MKNEVSTIMSTMQAIIATQAGGPDVLTLVERPVPLPSPGEVLIEVAAAGVNRPDLMQRSGAVPLPPGVTDVLGLEVAGRVVGGDAALRGQAVMALVKGGGYARYCIAKASHCLAVPEGLTMEQAAALPEALFTVWHNLFERGRLSKGETVLVHGGASGIGTIAIRMATARGATVIATVGSDAKKKAVEALGAIAINYRTDDFVVAARDATSGRGVDVVLDIVGGSYVTRNLDALAPGGRHVSLSFMEGGVVPIDLGLVMRKGLYLTSSTLRPKSDEEKTAIAAALRAEVLPLVASGEVRPLIWRTLPLGEAAQAHRILEANENIGKVLLLPAGAAA
ncbi:putative NAD(P)H quinone oxidoreductase, PIG3 family [Tardiphaga sp. OK246]|jgi:putative PIG3 family NAD(P)H quinone oxidoreductase|uniref:NAD(P)H-quinone oxidoreductase n=1 Tax=Tardiphaga sp. OK246 TaxID=1855307 RepID=UPI000B6D19C0|nr:NAD(P)H-quinone oxidoreductase [Tardiphaga sp. OK246]SNT30907.1 putative NAD(P)H quinone oxidoreductase, PIG3 family [Tardiphaga sp. OK246]